MDETPVRERFGLSTAENIIAFRRILEAARAFETLKLDVVEDKRLMLMMQDDEVACVFRGCDPLYTEAVMGIGGDGSEHKCGLTDKEGINFLRPDGQGFERYIALALTPQAFGGCAECRFFAMCKGQCPGTGIDGDWRNRSENCEVWRALFALAEAELIAEGHVPLSIHPRRREVEQMLLTGWSQGQNYGLSSLRSNMGIDLREAL
jgi:uncharacterized protein